MSSFFTSSSASPSMVMMAFSSSSDSTSDSGSSLFMQSRQTTDMDTTPNVSPVKEKPDSSLPVFAQTKTRTHLVTEQDSTTIRTPLFRSTPERISNDVTPTPKFAEDDLGYEAESEDEDGDEDAYSVRSISPKPLTTYTTATTMEKEESSTRVIAPVPVPTHRLGMVESPFERPERPNNFEEETLDVEVEGPLAIVEANVVGSGIDYVGIGLGVPQDVAHPAPRIPSYSTFEKLLACDGSPKEETNGQIELATIGFGLEGFEDYSPNAARMMTARKPALRPLVLLDDMSPMEALPSPKIAMDSNKGDAGVAFVGLGILGVDMKEEDEGAVGLGIVHASEEKDQVPSIPSPSLAPVDTRSEKSLIGLGIDMANTTSFDLFSDPRSPTSVSPMIDYHESGLGFSHSSKSYTRKSKTGPVGLGLNLPPNSLLTERSTIERWISPVVPPTLRGKPALPRRKRVVKNMSGIPSSPPPCRIPFIHMFGNLRLPSPIPTLLTLPSPHPKTPLTQSRSSGITGLLAKIDRERIYSPTL